MLKTSKLNHLAGLWFVISVTVLTAYMMIYEDELLSRPDLLFIFFAFISACILVVLFLRRPLEKALPLLSISNASLLLGAMIVYSFGKQFSPSFVFIRQFELVINKLDQGAEIDLQWAYWAEAPHNSSESIDDWVVKHDIGFADFAKQGNWQISSENYLSSAEKGSQLSFSAKGLHSSLPVLILSCRNGNARISVISNGKHKDYQLVSNNLEPTPVYVAFDKYSVFLSSLIFTIITAGLLIGFLVLCSLLVFRLQTSDEKQKSLIIYASSFFLPCISLLIICAILGVFPFGEKTFLINDMHGSYSDFMAYAKTWFTDNNDIFYTFSAALGDDFLTILAFFTINPLNLLTCLFPTTDLPQIISFLVIIRFALAGLTASIYIRKTHRLGYSTVLFACCYALMTYNVINSENTQLREGVILLPLVILGLENIFNDKSPFLYIFSLATAIILNFYSGFQICLFLCFFFCFRLCIESIPFKEVVNKIVHFISYSLIATGLCAILILPVALQLSGSVKEIDPNNLTFAKNFSIVELLSKFFTGAHNDAQISFFGLPGIFCGIWINTLGVLFFCNHRISIREKIFSFIVLLIFYLSMSTKLINLLWHGLVPPADWPYRYMFVVVFFIICLSARCFSEKDGLDLRSIFIGLIIVFGSSLLIFRQDFDYIDNGTILFDVLLSLAFCYLVTYLNRSEKRMTAILILLCGVLSFTNLTTNTFVILGSNMKWERSSTIKSFQDFYFLNSEVIEQIKSSDEGFYRIEKTYYRSQNDSKLLNYNGIAHYSSTTKQSILDFLISLGFHYFPYRLIYGEGSTISADSILGVKYLMSSRYGHTFEKPYNFLFEEDYISVYKNPYALPVAFVSSNKVLEQEMLFRTPFKFQNALFSSLTEENIGDIFTEATISSNTFHNLEQIIESGRFMRYRSTNSSEPAWIEWTIQVSSADELYMYLPSDEANLVDIYVNNEYKGRYFDYYSSSIKSLGHFEPGSSITVKMELLDRDVCFDDSLFYFESLDNLNKYAAELSKYPTSITKMSSSHLSGSFKANANNQALLFTIPFDDGWHLWIDEESVPLNEAADVFLSAPVSAGEHSYELRYIPKGLLSGAAISFLSLIVLIFIKSVRRKTEQ